MGVRRMGAWPRAVAVLALALTAACARPETSTSPGAQRAADLRILTDPAGRPGAVNTFWRARLGARWTPVKLVPYHDGAVPADACGRRDRNPDHFRSNAAYCPLDGTVAYSVELMSYLDRTGGPYLPVVVLEHEYGHRADHLGGHVGSTSLFEEDQADCDAGAETRFAHDVGRLPAGDVVSSAELFYSLGDRGVPFFTREANRPGAHGKPSERLASFLAGYRGEPRYTLAPCTKIARGASPYRLSVAPGS